MEAEAVLQCLLTLFVQMTMAMDQFLAVFYPFKHTKLRGILNKSMLAAFTAVSIVTLFVPFVLTTTGLSQEENKPAYLAAFVIVFLVGILLLPTVYTAVALKLYYNGRSFQAKPNRVNAQPTGTGASRTAGAAASTGTSQAGKQTQATEKKKRAMHIQALKVYASIFAAFIVAYSFSVAEAVTQSQWLGYGYYINHTINPVIYYCFVEKFRNSVKEYCSQMTKR